MGAKPAHRTNWRAHDASCKEACEGLSGSGKEETASLTSSEKDMFMTTVCSVFEGRNAYMEMNIS